ncbi:alkaline phosphatase family protein [Arthrobacter sp. 131MFCol6.1]|uniref:alkaline phosphatase family protein n=1 Tax=Arthrobacter sp. 131MFCol6.1 TaxID=1157944 RepID=UPI00036FD88D|nr:alkaline phosphatase family protein [Arthrobacter sp. 131MFCol6.1]
MTRIGRLALAGGWALAMLLAGCTPAQPFQAGPPSQSPTAGSPPAETLPAESPTESPPSVTPPPSPYFAQPAPHPAPGGPASGGIAHIVVIVQENKAASQIMGASEAGYFNKLAAEFSVAANYRAITHPSLPNYLALTSGTSAGITSDCKPNSCTADVRSIADEITQSGRTWKMYAEGMPAPCTAHDSRRYAVKHNPFMYYPAVTGNKASCSDHVVPYSRLGQDLQSPSTLPDYSFISPDMCNDTHDCPIGTGDDWLSREVPKILGSPAFTTQNSLLVLTWDEGSKEDNRVATVFAGPAARKGFTSNAAYSHYSLLHTIEDVWGLSPLTDDVRKAPLMGELLNH